MNEWIFFAFRPLQSQTNIPGLKHLDKHSYRIMKRHVKVSLISLKIINLFFSFWFMIIRFFTFLLVSLALRFLVHWTQIYICPFTALSNSNCTKRVSWSNENSLYFAKSCLTSWLFQSWGTDVKHSAGNLNLTWDRPVYLKNFIL